MTFILKMLRRMIMTSHSWRVVSVQFDDSLSRTRDGKQLLELGVDLSRHFV